MADPVIHAYAGNYRSLCGLDKASVEFRSTTLASLVTCKRCLKNRNLKP